MQSINDSQDEIIEEFSEMSTWMDRYAYIIDLGNTLETLPESQHTPDNLIDGCQSRLWLNCEDRDGKLYFQADSDAIIVKGLISLLIRVFSGRTPQEILDTDLYFIDRIGFKDNLSPTRSNGLLSMVKKIRAYALAFKIKEAE